MPFEKTYDFLFTTWEGGGNVSPVLTVARKLLVLGHRVRVMSDRCNRPEVEAAGAAFRPWRRAPSRPDKSPASDILRDAGLAPNESFGRLRDVIMCGPALEYARDLIDELERWPADLVVTSEMLFGVMAACEAQGQRLAILSPNICLFPIPGMPPFGAGLSPARTDEDRELHAIVASAGAEMFAEGLPALNRARTALGLRPIASVRHQLEAADRMLLATSPAFDFPAALPETIRYVGPQLDEQSWAQRWISPWPEGDKRPLVLVSFSTTAQGQGPALQRVVDGLSTLPVRAVVTLGPALSEDEVRSEAENVHICRSAPHGSVMRKAALVIGHGGHGTLMRALVHRLPVLLMPMGRDQDDNAARLTYHGAGLSLSPEASVEEIRKAVRRLLVEPGFATAARRLGNAIAADAASPTVVSELFELASQPRDLAAAGTCRAA